MLQRTHGRKSSKEMTARDLSQLKRLSARVADHSLIDGEKWQ